jgi:sugar lactone lactonase YvrE
VDETRSRLKALQSVTIRPMSRGSANGLLAMAEFKTLLKDLVLVESPRWHDDRLIFSDWGAGEIIAVDLDGEHEMITRIDAMPFCIDRLPDGRMVIVAGEDLLVRSSSGKLSRYAELGTLSTNPWNDIVTDGRGNTYVNNIGFDFPDGEFAPGFIARVSPDGTARQVAEGLAFPNGMAVTPDNSTLIVAESYASVLTAYDIAPDGDLADRRVWAELGEASPDGICIDAEGAVWFAEVPGRRCVRVAEGGEVLQTIACELGCFACMLGGPNGTTLFVTAAAWPEAMTPGSRTGQILSAEVAVPHAGWPA